MLNPNVASAGGGLVSSSALLLVIAGVLAIFLTHRGIGGWVASRHTAVREHLYGPEELYEPMTDRTDAENDSENPGGTSDVEPDDGFDYGIFAAAPHGPQ